MVLSIVSLSSVRPCKLSMRRKDSHGRGKTGFIRLECVFQKVHFLDVHLPGDLSCGSSDI